MHPADTDTALLVVDVVVVVAVVDMDADAAQALAPGDCGTCAVTVGAACGAPKSSCYRHLRAPDTLAGLD